MPGSRKAGNDIRTFHCILGKNHQCVTDDQATSPHWLDFSFMSDNSEPPSTQPQRWARVPPGLAWKRPGLPTDWVPVLERHPYPDGLSNDGYPLPGYVWLDMPGKARHVSESALEFSFERPEELEQ
jgi:hypothetical protein